jgi:hypothetical protein
MVAKFLSGNEQSDSADDDDNVNAGSHIQHGTWTKVGAKQSHFPFSGEPGLNVDLEDCNNPLKYFELFIIPKLANLKQRNKPACQQFLDNMLNLRGGGGRKKSRV